MLLPRRLIPSKAVLSLSSETRLTSDHDSEKIANRIKKYVFQDEYRSDVTSNPSNPLL